MLLTLFTCVINGVLGLGAARLVSDVERAIAVRSSCIALTQTSARFARLDDRLIVPVDEHQRPSRPGLVHEFTRSAIVARGPGDEQHALAVAFHLEHALSLVALGPARDRADDILAPRQRQCAAYRG